MKTSDKKPTMSAAALYYYVATPDIINKLNKNNTHTPDYYAVLQQMKVIYKSLITG